MTGPTPEVRRELERLLEKDQTRLGDVYRLTYEGLDQEEIAAHLGVPTSGFVWHSRRIMKAVLEGDLPEAATVKRNVAGSIRTRLRGGNLSDEASGYLQDLLDRLTLDDPNPRPTHGSLREQVDAELRQRTQALVRVIGEATGVEADDYFAVVSSHYALDEILRLIMTQATGRTTKKLASVGRLDLSLEEAVAKWASDLPLGIDLVEAARGRVAYWRSA